MRKKLTVTLLVICLILSAAMLAACNRNKGGVQTAYGDIYVSHNGATPFDEAKLLVTLGENVTPYKNSNGEYHEAYIQAYNLFACQKVEGEDTFYGIYSISDSKYLGDGVVYKSFSISNGFVSLLDGDGKFILMTVDGNVIFGADAGYPKNGETALSKAFVPISYNYIAVHASTGKLYNIYKRDGTAVLNADGTLFSVTSDFYGNSETFGLRANDDFLARSEYYVSSGNVYEQNVRYYNLLTGEVIIDNVFAGRGDFAVNDTVRAAYYLGDGRLLCFQQNTSDETAYQYKLNDYYYKLVQWTYDLNTKKTEILSNDIIYSVVVNAYNTADTSNDITQYLRTGYSWASVAYLRAADKTVTSEQLIFDSNLNIYVSADSTLGTATNYDSGLYGLRDVLISFVGDVGFAPESTGDLLLYDARGGLLLKVAGTFSDVVYNNGIVTAKKTFYDEDGEEKYSYYAAFNIDGSEIFDAEARKYTEITPFVGGYAMARDTDNICFIVDRNGIESAVGDMYSSGSGSSRRYFYKSGAYVTYASTPDGNRYGLKAFDGTVIFENKFNNIVIDNRGIGEVMYYANNGTAWEIYKLG